MVEVRHMKELTADYPIDQRPPGWFESKLTQSLEKAHLNLVANFASRKEPIVIDILNDLFTYLRDSHDNTSECAYVFFLRSYSFWIAAVRLWGSEQVTEAYALIRCSIECVLYGNFLTVNEHNEQITQMYFERRNAQGERLKEINIMFGVSKLAKALPEWGDMAMTIYKSSIELGAHPNPFGMFHSIEDTEQGKQKVGYLGADDKMVTTCGWALLSTALVVLSNFGCRLLSESKQHQFNERLMSAAKTFRTFMPSKSKPSQAAK